MLFDSRESTAKMLEAFERRTDIERMQAAEQGADEQATAKAAANVARREARKASSKDKRSEERAQDKDDLSRYNSASRDIAVLREDASR